MFVSIIIPAYNAEKTLSACLAACLNQTRPADQIIVVDDGSQDKTALIAKDFAVTYIYQQNRGPAAARNAGAKIARGDILVFTDNDCVPHSDWLEQLLTGFTEDAGAVGGTYGHANTESCLAAMIHAEIVERHARFGERVDFLGSFNLAVQKTAFKKVGGFDESFPRASAEDNDLSYRLTGAGYSLAFVRTAIVDHYHPARLIPYLRTQMRHGYWRMKLYAKHIKKAGGDRYAGILDLIAPVLGLFFLIGILFGGLFLPLFSMNWSIRVLFISFLVAMLDIVIHLPLCWQMMLRARRPLFMFFAWVQGIRDIARGIGMIAGTIRFLLIQKVVQ